MPASLPAKIGALVTTALRFFPEAGPSPTAVKAGFRFGDKGTHSSRTLMFEDLASLFASTADEAIRETYAAAIIDQNCLHKPTVATRRHSNQRLGELYGLDRAYLLFRILRRVWNITESDKPLLALVAALARDPLLMASAQPIIGLPIGAELQRSDVRDALQKSVGERMNDSVIDKVVRNVSSSWTQSGHLEGRTFKFRRSVTPSAPVIAFALSLAHIAGFRGNELLSSGWIAVLDCTPAKAKGLALEAKRLGLIDFWATGEVVELGLERLEPALARG